MLWDKVCIDGALAKHSTNPPWNQKPLLQNCAAQTEFVGTYQASVPVCGMCAVALALVKKYPLLGVIS